MLLDIGERLAQEIYKYYEILEKLVTFIMIYIFGRFGLMVIFSLTVFDIFNLMVTFLAFRLLLFRPSGFGLTYQLDRILHEKVTKKCLQKVQTKNQA